MPRRGLADARPPRCDHCAPAPCLSARTSASSTPAHQEIRHLHASRELDINDINPATGRQGQFPRSSGSSVVAVASRLPSRLEGRNYRARETSACKMAASRGAAFGARRGARRGVRDRARIGLLRQAVRRLRRRRGQGRAAGRRSRPPGLAPIVDVGGGQCESAIFAWLNTNKRSVIVAPGDSARLIEIAGAVDVLIDARPGAWDDDGPAGQAALRSAFPQLTIVSISWFGESGPYKDYPGDRQRGAGAGGPGPRRRAARSAGDAHGASSLPAGGAQRLQRRAGGADRGWGGAAVRNQHPRRQFPYWRVPGSGDDPDRGRGAALGPQTTSSRCSRPAFIRPRTDGSASPPSPPTSGAGSAT